MEQDLELVNLVGSGQLDSEIDLRMVEQDILLDTVFIRGPGLYFRFEDDGPTIILARSGKYIITGADSTDQIQEARNDALDLLFDMGVIEASEDSDFTIKNAVFTADLETELKLNVLATNLGLNQIEYEPEQFPGLIFRPKTEGAIGLIFSSGKVVITGATDRTTAKSLFEFLRGQVEEIHSSGM